MLFNILVWKPFLFRLQQRIKHWAKPATLSLISGVLSDLTRNRSDLVVENALLGQQLIVLNRQGKQNKPLIPPETIAELIRKMVKGNDLWVQGGSAVNF